MQRATTRSAAWRQLGLIKRSEKVDTRLMLRIADAVARLDERAGYSLEQCAEIFAVPIQGGVSPVDRLREAEAVVEFWPDNLLAAAIMFNAPWHALVEPSRWDDVDSGAVFSWVSDYVENTAAWPSVGATRRAFGRTSNHPLPGERIKGQGALDYDHIPSGQSADDVVESQ